jgi:hypothetical protein
MAPSPANVLMPTPTPIAATGTPAVHAAPFAAAAPIAAPPAASPAAPLCNEPAMAAASALPSLPPEGTMGTLPAGWHACVHPEHRRTYYFNTVTQQSQWHVPTAAAAVPLPMLPTPAAPPTGYTSPNTVSRNNSLLSHEIGNQIGDLSQMARSYGLTGTAPPSR